MLHFHNPCGNDSIMNMSKLSVPQAAERLGVSPARVRQRVEDGSLVAEKIGGRWLVDLEASQSAPAQAGRPVAAGSIWWSLIAAEVAKAAMPAVDIADLRKALMPAAEALAKHKVVMGSVDVSGIEKGLKPVLDSGAFTQAVMPAFDVSALQKALKPAQDSAALRKTLIPAIDASGIQEALKPAREAAAIQKALLARMKLAEVVLADLEPAGDRGQHSAGAGPDWVGANFVAEAKQLSRSSRNRAVHRVADAVENRDHEALLAWLNNRAHRRLYVAAPADLESLRMDDRLVISGVSHPDSGLDDPRVVEGYIEAAELDAIVADHWLERPGIDERPNVVLHAAPVRPPAVGPVLLAADLSEHRGPREIARAHELLDEWMAALLPDEDRQLPA